MNPTDHQALVRRNIESARANGDHERAAMLERVYAPLLAIDLSKPLTDKEDSQYGNALERMNHN